MKNHELLQMIRDIKDVAIATVDKNGLPKVRIIDIMLVEDEKLYFCTARGKDFYRQLIAGKNIALTGMNDRWQMIRLEAAAKRLPDRAQKEWIDKIFAANDSIADLYKGDSRYILEAFVIDAGQMELFDLGQEPVYRETLTLGGAKAAPKGFAVSERCTGCGICQKNCPQGCITAGEPYKIAGEHCLHCGLCFECCPSGAVYRL